MALMLGLPTLEALGALGPLNDLLALGHGIGQQPAKATVQQNAEPPLVATPRAQCGPGAKREPGIQGRVPAGAATDGLHCNVSLVGRQGTSGGFKVLRYVDTGGRECAFYDTALLYPVNALKLDTTSQGVAVIDMSDPAHPVQTDTLTELPMLSPHESLNLNPRRGLLAAVLGNPSTYPGLVSIYDVRQDCRHPVLQSTRPVARIGHESGFSPDGKTFWASGTAFESITAVDVTDPKSPHAVWQGNIVAHGMTIRGDGNRAYIADPAGEMLILDTSEIQARKPNPQAREVSRLTWKSASIPQNAIPFTSGGKPYVLEFDEYTDGTTGAGNRDAVGAARIIDISDERAPRVVSNLRLQVNQPEDHAAASGDPGALSPVQGYAAHYCSLSSEVDPTVVGCSFITSGLRVFDITDLLHPQEIAYYVAPTQPRAENGFMASDFAMSKPVIVPDRREVWYTDGTTGFYVLRVAPEAWPSAAGRAACLARRGRISRRGIGRVRLGMKRSALPPPRRTTRRSWRWCVSGGGRVAAAFTKSGRVALVAATTRRHRVRVVASRRARTHPKLLRAYRRIAGL
jgi:LVIVD repeat-containing protein